MFNVSGQAEIVTRFEVRDLVTYRQPIFATFYISADIKGVGMGIDF